MNPEAVPILGVDFTSHPTAKKPLTGAQCRLDGDTLRLETVHRWPSFEDWTSHLESMPSGWAAHDFPFGLPFQFVEGLGWPKEWSAYVELVRPLGRARFAALVRQYASLRPAGDKYHSRASDRRTGACSPMMVDYTPVGRMFAEGAPRLARLDADIRPCRPRDAALHVVEAYPGVLARRFCRSCYKSEARRDPHATERLERRRQIVDGILSPDLERIYGVKLNLGPVQPEWLIEDPKADTLDAVLCAIQAAWASRNPLAPCDPNEGVIADPATYL